MVVYWGTQYLMRLLEKHKVLQFPSSVFFSAIFLPEYLGNWSNKQKILQSIKQLTHFSYLLL